MPGISDAMMVPSHSLWCLLAISAGLGLVGMRERVAVHAGEFHAGPRRNGGFQVRARFQLTEQPAAAASR